MSYRYQRRYTGPLQAVIFDWAGTVVDFGSFAPTQVLIDAGASPGMAAVKGVYRVDDQALEEIKALAASGEKVLYTFGVDITQKDGTIVAQVTKVLYIRLKKQYRPQSN